MLCVLIRKHYTISMNSMNDCNIPMAIRPHRLPIVIAVVLMPIVMVLMLATLYQPCSGLLNEINKRMCEICSVVGAVFVALC